MDIAQLLAALGGASPEQKDALRKALDTSAGAGEPTSGLTLQQLNASLETFRKSLQPVKPADFTGAAGQANLVDGTGFLDSLTKSLTASATNQNAAIDKLGTGVVTAVAAIEQLTKAVGTMQEQLAKALSAPLPSHAVTQPGTGAPAAGAPGAGAPNKLEEMTAGQLEALLMKSMRECGDDAVRMSAIQRAIVDYETGATPTVEALAALGINLG